MIELIGIFAGISVIIAFILNGKKHIGCWPAWIISAILWIIYGILKSAIALTVQNTIFIFVFIWAWKKWKNDRLQS